MRGILYYNPTLYYSDGQHSISWIKDNEKDPLIKFSERSIKKSIELAYNYCSENKIINMKERNITVTLEKAKEWFNSGDATLKEVALQAFSEKELTVFEFDFTKIKTFEDALNALEYPESTKIQIKRIISDIYIYSKASAAAFKLNIIRKALNLGQDLHLTKNPKDSYIYYPRNPFVTESSTYYRNELNSGKMKVIGKIESEGVLYNVLGGNTINNGYAGLGSFRLDYATGSADSAFGFLGCASEEIAQHFSKYFGMLITEAKYGDMVDFKVIKDN